MRSKCDIGVLVLCVVFALASLGAVGGHGRTRAKEAVCRSHLRQWASVFDTATLDNGGNLPSRGLNAGSTWWIDLLWAYHQDAGLFLCPAAMETSFDVLPTHRAWRSGERVASYGANGWVGNPMQDMDGRGYAPRIWHWQTPRIWGADAVPVLADMTWGDAWPRYIDWPPATEQFSATDGTNEMQRACINRHDGAINLLFMDWSVRQVGLKELWSLKWYKQYNTAGPWTIAGGVTPADWPEWMRQFKDF